MAVKDFASLAGTTTTFSGSADVLALTGDPSGYRFDEVGASVVVTRQSDSVAVTLSGVSQEELTTSNLIFSGSSASGIFGDNAVTTSSDNNPNTITNGNVGITSTNLDLNNLIYGLGGGDTVTVGNGNNVIFGGMGIVDTSDGNDVINLGTGSNLVYGNAGADDINFNSVVAAGQTATIYGGVGNDSIGALAQAHTGNIVAYGNADSDAILLGVNGTGNVTIYGGSGVADSSDGADSIASGTGNALIYGNAGDDLINYGAVVANKAQSIYGGLGNDTIGSANAAVGGAIGALASGSSVVMFGNAGTDTLNVSAAVAGSNVTIYGGDGVTDTADGADTITLGAGNALVYGNAGNDVVGLGGTASLAASNQATVYLGLGDDTLSNATNVIAGTLIVYGNEGADNISTSTADTGSMTLDGGAGADIITISAVQTNAGTTSIVGGDDNDTISINVALDRAFTIDAGAGVDTVTIGALADEGLGNISLGAGADVITVTAGGHASSILTISGGDDGDAINTANTAYAGKLVVDGGAGADTIGGGNIGDSLAGGAGTDSISGGAGADTIDGGDDADTISGGAAADSITGGAGADSITGGAAADTMTGGDGADTYIIASATDTGTSGTDGDKIMDFVSGTDKYNTDFSTTGGTTVTYTVNTQAVNTSGALAIATTAGNAGVQQFTGCTLTEAAASLIDHGDDLGTILSSGAITCSAVGNTVLVAIKTATDTFLYQVTESGANTSLVDAADNWVLACIFDNAVTLATGDII